MRKTERRFAIALCFAAVAAAQSPQFEAATVKPAKPTEEGVNIHGDPNGRLNADNVTLKDLVRFAWQLKDYQIEGGPKWLDADRFDIVAKPESRADPDQLLLMMQALLADRFRLAFHRESKEARIYELTVAKGGPKLRAPAPDGRRGIQGRKGQITAGATPMSVFAQYLSQRLGQTVVDKTSLAGDFDFTLEYQPDDSGAGPSIFTALQEQLGLRLQPAKGSVTVFVIDRAEKPGDN